jgi:hypothetical protein
VVLLTELLMFVNGPQITGFSPSAHSVVCDEKHLLSADFGDGSASGLRLLPLLSVVPKSWFFD